MEIIALRLIHVLGGIFWVGTVLFTTFFLLPVLAQAGPAAGTVMAGLRQRRLLTVLPLVALLTIGSGLRLLWLGSAGLTAAYFTTPSGQAYAGSGLAAIVAFLVGVLVTRPATARLGALTQRPADQSAPGQGEAEIADLRRRVALSSAVVTFLLTAAAVGMAVARYV